MNCDGGGVVSGSLHKGFSTGLEYAENPDDSSCFTPETNITAEAGGPNPFPPCIGNTRYRYWKVIPSHVDGMTRHL
jgi:hypothetical protein